MTNQDDNYSQEYSYQPTSLETIQSYSNTINFAQLVNDLTGQEVQWLSIEDSDYYQAVVKLFTQDNLDILKAWMVSSLVYSNSDLTSDQAGQAKDRFEQEVYGSPMTKTMEEKTFDENIFTFNHVVGNFYGKKYFGEDGKQDVTQMVQAIVNIYKEKLKANTWLSEENKAKAIDKLNHITINVGYPEDYGQVYHDFKVDTSSSYCDNFLTSQKFFKQKISSQ